MIYYLLYRIGYFLAAILPLKACYFIACTIADTYCLVSRREREAIIKNFQIILDDASENRTNEFRAMARDVFRNFAKYLVDFFRVSRVSRVAQDYIKKYVKIEGLNNIDEALSKGKGVIVLSAHIGNWELGGITLSLMGYPMSAVVLTHQNKKVNAFFTRQRMLGRMKPIEIGMTLRSCYDVLKKNNLLGLLGDRDFSGNGLYVEFFGKKALIPKGPSVFSYRMGSAIVPSFMVREPDDTFKLICEEPIFPSTDENEEAALKTVTERYLSVVESYIKRYPAQWYMFREFWNNNDSETVRPNTII